MKRVILFLIICLTSSTVCLAQGPNQSFWNDTIGITTYYPSPHGVYGTMRLYPSDTPTEGVGPGVMYFNRTDNTTYVYRNESLRWQPLGGGTATQLDTNNNACNATKEGAVRYSTALKNIEFCDGSAWQAVGMMYTGMIAGRISITSSWHTSSGSISYSCSAASPGQCSGTSPNFQPACKAGWSTLYQKTDASNPPFWQITTVVYTCVYN